MGIPSRMNDEPQAQTTSGSDTPPALANRLLQSIGSNALLLGLFALCCTGFIAATFLGTEQNILKQQRAARLKALLEIVPATQHSNDLLQDNIKIHAQELGLREPKRLFLALQKTVPVALIYPATARDGYSGDINYIVGINLADNTIAGVRVLGHRETPGLGDGIEVRKSNWIKSFNGKRLGLPALQGWTVKKDGGVFDGFTGATITPRALVTSVARVLQYHAQHGTKHAQALLEQHQAKQASEPASQPPAGNH